MTRRPFASLIFAVALVVTAAVVAASENLPVQRAGTIETRFLISDPRGAPALQIAGLASERTGVPDILVLQWEQDAAGWFPVWKLRLKGRPDLLPPGLVDRHEEGASIIELADVEPKAGHEYRAVFSYDPRDQVLSLLLEDVTDGAVAYAGHLTLLHQAGLLYPAAGLNTGESTGDTPTAPGAATTATEVLEFTVNRSPERHGLPLAVQRQLRTALLEVAPQDGSVRRKLGREYLAGDPVGIRLEWPDEPVPGEVRLLLVHGGDERLLSAFPWRAGTQDILLNASDLPMGDSHLVLEYAHGDHRAEIVRHPLQVIEAKLRVSYTLFGRDYDANRLTGELTLTPEMGIVADGELVVTGMWEGVDFLGPASSEPFVLLRHPLRALAESISLPLEIPAPQPPHPAATLRLEASLEGEGSPLYVSIAGASRQYAVAGIPEIQDPGLFPFVVNPWQESPDNVTNIAHWLDRPAGKHGHISIQDGHFVTGDGTPIRFLGVNCAFAGCFPDHATAEKLARQLARFGINLVRFHHMDMQEAPAGIWRRGAFPRELDPVQLDRLDYFIYQLKENGIYSNLNLHVSRTMTPQEGFPEPERRPDFDKGLSLFDPVIMAHQKEYARALLTHRNPYTGNRYVDEPALAMIEITNENGLILFTQWGAIDALPQRYQEALDRRWQEWLTRRYGSTEALAAAWGGGDLTTGVELASNGRLERGLSRWTLETDDPREAAMRPLLGKGSPLADLLAPALEVRVFAKGTVSWRPQVYHTGLNLQPGRLYLVSFRLKSDRPHTITANLMMHHDPWIGFGALEAAVTTEWQRFELAVRVPESAQVREGRVSFTNLQAGATYWIADLSVQELAGDGEGLPPGESLETSVSRPRWQSLGLRSSRVRQDYIEFLWDVERGYFEEMYRFIKEELGARAAIAGTQVQWSPPGIQAGLDYVDVHAYWNHPEFPGASWDAANWFVRNTSMTGHPDGGTVASLAHTRVAGKPYVVSEYNHPAPITFGSEAFLLTGAYAAFQDWDGLVAFAWSHDADFWPQRIPNFFDIKSHPTKLVTLPAVAALFLRGDVRPAEQVVYAPLPDDVQRRRLLETTVFGVGSGDGGVPPVTALQHRIAVAKEGVDVDRSAAPVDLEPPRGTIITSDTGELRWERGGAGRSVAVVDTERSKAVIGFGAGRTFDLSGVTVTPGPTRQHGWSAITLTVMEGAGFGGPARILVTATGYAENVGMGWEHLGDDMITVRNRWGEAPSLVEGVPARIELPVPPELVRVYALDGAGYRRRSVPVRAGETAPGRSVIDLGPEYRTLWYEVAIDGR